MCAGLLSSKAPKPLPPPPPPVRSDAEIQAAMLAERRRRALAAGRGATIVTGGQGDLSPTPAARKTLLGE